ncbi:MAG: HD domain-containing protein [Anaerolineae bacterium]|nr:HD domain-containing protein [Anaerolineae bacterium]
MAERVLAEELLARTLPVVEARHDESWLVGGWVRDHLLGIETRDIDFVVPAGAIATARVVADTVGGDLVVLDRERDTARVLVGEPRHVIYLDFAMLRAPSIEADLLARDFTVNALAVPTRAWRGPEGAVIDPAGGRRDLERRLLRAVSVDSFREDPLRMLRAVRLRASLGFELEGETASWIERDAELIDAVSRERVRDELSLILAQVRPAESLRLADELGLLARVIPEIEPLRAVPAAAWRAGSAWDHSLDSVEIADRIVRWLRGAIWADEAWPGQMLTAALAPYRLPISEHMAEVLPGGHDAAILLLLAALLHDVGKSAARQEGAGDEERLLGHDVLGGSIAATVTRRLCYSGAETDRVRTVVSSHMRPGQLVREMGPAPSERAIYRFFRDTRAAGVDTILLSLADHWATRGEGLEREHWRRHLALSRALLEAYFERREQVVEPPVLIDGHELMASLGLGPGPQVGELLESIREAQAAGEVRSREDALARARRLLEGGGPLQAGAR